jgi:phosphoserine phosphatase
LAPEGILAPGGWLPENRQRLERLIREYGKGGPRWDPRHPPVAAFDWDGTMIIGDAGDALFFHLIREMGFKFSDGDRFWGLIPEEFGRGAIRASYEEIKGLPLGEAKKTAAYRRYRKLFHRAYLMEQERSGRLHSGFGWPLELMSGLTVQEVERASEEALRRELSVPLGEEIVSEGPQDPSPIRIAAGVRPAAEMFDLASRLQEHGWDVRIVSGSNEWIVAAFAALAGIPRSRVHGALSRINGGRLTAEVVQKSWARGKARVLQERALKPLLAAGDGPYDEELLRLSSGERLVIDRGAQNLLSLAKRRGWMVQPPFPAAGE